MTCIILAAGYATRLYPVTENFPKPLLEVKGKSILDWLLDDIVSTGLIDKFAVVTNSKFFNHFQKWASLSSYEITVLDDGTSTNETRLGAVKDLWFTIERLNLSNDLLVIAGDNLLDFSLTGFINYSMQKSTSCIMRYHEDDLAKLTGRGMVDVRNDDQVVKMWEKPDSPKSRWCVPPFYYFVYNDAMKIPQAISEGCGVDAPGSFIEWLCERSIVYAMEMPGKRFDIGCLESYKKICEEYVPL